MSDARRDALDIFQYALKASRVEAAMERRVRFEGGALQIDGHVLPTVRIRRVVALDEAPNRKVLKSLAFSADLDVE